MLIAAAAITDCLTSPTRVLAAQRSYPAELRGQWELPGGKVESGERPEDACRREIAEELGTNITLGEELGTWRLPNGCDMRVWWALASSEPTAGASHEQIRWCTADNILDLPWLAGDAALVRLLADRLAGPTGPAKPTNAG